MAFAAALARRVRWRDVAFQVFTVEQLARTPASPGVFLAGNWTRQAFHVGAVGEAADIRAALLAPAVEFQLALGYGATDVAISPPIDDAQARAALQVLLIDAFQPIAQSGEMEPQQVAAAAETWRRYWA